MSNEKALNSENLLLQSQDFDTTWSQVGLSSRSGGNADPAGGTTAHRFVEDSSSATHRVYQTVSSTGKTSLTVYAKQAAGTRYLALKVSTGAGGPYEWVVATYDLAGGTPAMTTGTGATSIAKTSSQTLSGGGFYKCTLTVESSGGGVNVSMSSSATPSPANYGHVEYAGDGASAIDVAFSSLNTTGATDYNATTTQISRGYSPLLKTASADSPRFEFATDGQSVGSGTALGLLVESQASNLATYGSDLTNAVWNPLSATAATAAIGPDGTLSAAKLTSGTGSGIYPRFRRLSFLSTSKTQTFSVYVKPLEYSYLNISQDGHSTQMVHYNLTGSGSISSASGCSGTVEQCGNGWFRVSFTHTNATSSVNLAIVMQSTATYSSETGNSYDGMLFASAQLEDAAAASSFIGTTSSTVTRSADSCSVALSDINFVGGEYTLIADADTISADNVFVSASLYVSNSNYAALYANGLYSRTVVAVSDGVNSTVNGGSANGRIAASGGTNSLSVCINGGSVTTDTSYTVPDLSGGTLQLGTRNGSSSPLNGNLKRVSLFNVALSDTELQALTS